MQAMNMKQVYLVLAIVGAIVPYVWLLDHFATAGFSLSAFLEAALATDVAAAMTADVMLSSIAFWVFMFSRPAAPRPWLFIGLNLIVGLSCALPAYLYADARSRAF